MRQLIFLLLATTFIPTLSLANGGDQRVVENKYFINLSRAPFTPRVGISTAFLASFSDIQNNQPIQEDLIARVKITRFESGGTSERKLLFDENNIQVIRGILELPYTFEEAGIHEIYFYFAFASSPQRTYEAPDFLIDVQPASAEDQSNSILLAGFAAGIIGILVGYWARSKKA